MSNRFNRDRTTPEDGSLFDADTLLEGLPAVLVKDRNMAALARATAQILAGRRDELQLLAMYAQIDQMPEELLDILAYDFKVDWWDQTYTLEEKRQTLKDSWIIHRTLGTKAAVERAISAIYPGSTVSEWWEYGGQPYHFRLMVDGSAQQIDPEKYARVLDRVNVYKNLRSVMDDIEFVDVSGKAQTWAYVGYIGCNITDSGTAT